MYEIMITDDQDLLTIEPRYVRLLARQVLGLEQVVRATISVAIVDDTAIHALNRQFLQHDYPTDVISFVLEEHVPRTSKSSPRARSSAKDKKPRGAGKALDGEIIISAEMAAERAPEFGWEAMDEFSLYLVHGLLHLCGYDDLSESEQTLMRAREREVLEALGLQTPPRSPSPKPKPKRKTATKTKKP